MRIYRQCSCLPGLLLRLEKDNGFPQCIFLVMTVIYMVSSIHIMKDPYDKQVARGVCIDLDV